MATTAKMKSLPNIPIPDKLIKPNPFLNDKKPVESNLLSFVSSGLEFDADVVQRICPSAISFTNFNGRSLYVPSREISSSPRPPHRLQPLVPLTISKARWEHARRVLAQKPIAIEPVKFRPQQSLFYMTEIDDNDEHIHEFKQEIIDDYSTPTTRSESSEETDENTSGIRRGHDNIEKQARILAEKDFSQMERNWDKYMFEHMDENTAKFIILKHVHDDDRRARLIEYLKKTYNITKLPNPQEIELIPTTDDQEKNADEHDSKKLQSQILEKDADVPKREIPLYRLPRGLRRRAKEEKKEDGKIILQKSKFPKKSIFSLQLASAHIRPSQQIITENTLIRREPSFYDIMSNKILSTVYRTDHPYEQAMLLGNNMHKPTDEPGVIVLSNKLQFDKVLQKQLPPDPDSIATTLQIDSSAAFDRQKPARGFRRWKALPAVKDTHPPRPPDVNDLSLSWLMPSTPDARLYQILKSNTTISRIIEEWRRKWQVGSQWLDADIEELYQDLHDIHPHVRFTAIVVCSRAAQYLTQKEIDLGLKVHLLPEKLLQSIESLLNDSQEHVRTAAAIALVTLHRFSSKVEDILRSCVANGNPDDKLTAAQCLASLNYSTSDVIHELLKNYFDAEDELTREQLILALAKLSQRTNLVHSLTGEYLNSADSSDRIVACKLFPLLKSRPNKDITQKLIHLMWQDMNSSVRRVAGQALGKCGCGQAVHEEVVLRLQSQHWQDRVEALKLIGYLGVLTAKLMQPFLKCFKDDHVSVRDHACRTTYKLQLRDETIRNLLIDRVEFDPIEKVRYSAVEALGLYGMTNAKCRSVLLWAVRYDKSPLVRASSPNALVLLEKASEDIIDTLQSRFLVEKEPIVVQSLKEALEAYHCNLSQDVPIVQEIRNEVRKLNTKNTILEKIMNLEKDLRLTAAMERLIAPLIDTPPTPSPGENEIKSTTTFTNYIKNVADTNANANDVPEVWSPELWHSDSKTGKIRKHRLPHNEAPSQDEPITMTIEPEQSSYSLQPAVLLPVEEEESETEEDTIKKEESLKQIHLRTASKGKKSSLYCYDCSAHNPDCAVHEATLVSGCETCMVYLNANDGNNVVRRCCKSGCGSPGNIGEYDGRKAYFCSSNQCNGIGTEKVLTGEADLDSINAMIATLPPMKTTITTTMTTTETTTSTTIQTSFQCYECSGPDCGREGSSVSVNCPRCMVYRNPNDQTIIERRCCWWACGSPNSVSSYNGLETYFCAADKCNGYGAESALSPPVTTTTTTTITTTTTAPPKTSFECYECSGPECGKQGSPVSNNCPRCMVYRNPNDQITTTTTTTVTTTTTAPPKTSFECYECSGPDCGKQGLSVSNNCPRCMVYRNPNDQTIIERRCCWWSCGSPNSVSNYNGLETYFCGADKCNGDGAESALSPPVTTTTTTIITTTTTSPPKTSFQCYECSGSNCGREGSSLSSNCPSCMVYRNPNDQTIIERRCCWWSCGSPNSVSNYDGLETYFCTADKCNGYGAESALRPPVTTTTTTVRTTTTTTATTTTMTTTITTMTTTTTISTTTTTTTAPKTSFQCYDCSGPSCGREGSSISNNCPSCMVYRNPNDQMIIERRCCWWGCGPSNSIGSHNGLETYFCAADKCNGLGTEFALMTTTAATTTTVITTTSSSPASCVLNCQNGSTPETEDGCFCYCLENTNGRECENVDCAQPDVNSEICSIENQQLCEESETFAFECLHLCGKC
ncbi:unnamed protein product [Rotaria sp. Silwood2]|nr:unnamed protein product [Rotaria sp. Silwood2]